MFEMWPADGPQRHRVTALVHIALHTRDSLWKQLLDALQSVWLGPQSFTGIEGPSLRQGPGRSGVVIAL